MYKFLTKNGQTIAFILGTAIVLIFFAMVVTNQNYETFSNMDADGIKDVERYKFGMFDFGLMATVGLIIIGYILMFGFGLFQALTNIKGSLGAIAGLALIAIIFAIGYSTTDIETSGDVYKVAQKFNLSDGVRKFVGGAITTGVALTAIGGLAIVLSEVRNFFK